MMKKILKSKRGFTLIEMVLTIAIIVVLAAIIALGVGGYIQRADNAALSVSQHNSLIESVSALT